MKIINTLAFINPTALPALRIVGTIVLLITLAAGAYLFRNRHRFFDRDPEVANDIPAVRHLRIEIVLIPWLAVTTVNLVLLISFWIC